MGCISVELNLIIVLSIHCSVFMLLWFISLLELLARDYEEFKVPDANNDDVISFEEVGP